MIRRPVAAGAAEAAAARGAEPRSTELARAVFERRRTARRPRAAAAPRAGPRAHNGAMKPRPSPRQRRPTTRRRGPRRASSAARATRSSARSTASCIGSRGARRGAPAPGAVVERDDAAARGLSRHGQRHALDFPDRAHFLAYAARAMRTVADRPGARRRGAEARRRPRHHLARHADGGDSRRAGDARATSVRRSTSWPSSSPSSPTSSTSSSSAASAVAEIAAMRGVSERTVQRQWEKARLLLFRALAARP